MLTINMVTDASIKDYTGLGAVYELGGRYFFYGEKVKKIKNPRKSEFKAIQGGVEHLLAKLSSPNKFNLVIYSDQLCLTEDSSILGAEIIAKLECFKSVQFKYVKSNQPLDYGCIISKLHRIADKIAGNYSKSNSIWSIVSVIRVIFISGIHYRSVISKSCFINMKGFV